MWYFYIILTVLFLLFNFQISHCESVLRCIAVFQVLSHMRKLRCRTPPTRFCIPADTYRDFPPYTSCKSGFPSLVYAIPEILSPQQPTRRGATPRHDIMIIHLYSYAIGSSTQEGTEGNTKSSSSGSTSCNVIRSTLQPRDDGTSDRN